MNTYRMRKMVRSEIENLNRRIDEKIVRGLSYAREARRHKFLISKLYDLKRNSGANWFDRSFGFVSTLMF